MAKIAFVTDNSAYSPAELNKRYQITVAPQILIFGDQTYSDGMDIQPDEFYRRLNIARSMPRTSQVSVVTMQSVFHE